MSALDKILTAKASCDQEIALLLERLAGLRGIQAEIEALRCAKEGLGRVEERLRAPAPPLEEEAPRKRYARKGGPCARIPGEGTILWVGSELAKAGSFTTRDLGDAIVKEGLSPCNSPALMRACSRVLRESEDFASLGQSLWGGQDGAAANPHA